MPQTDHLDKPFATTRIVCSVLIEKNGKYVLIQEKQPSVYGQWNLPGGRVDEGETLEQAAIREAKEECGFEVALGKELVVQHLAAHRPVFHVFEATIVGGKLEFPEYEIMDAKWFTRDEILAMKGQLREGQRIIDAINANS